MKKVDFSLLFLGYGNNVCLTPEWLEIVMEMSNLLNCYHSPNSILESHAYVLKYSKLLKSKFFPQESFSTF